MQEIERKFLVRNTQFLQQSIAAHKIVQGYLSSHPERTVRIRIRNNQGFITIKGKGDSTGTTRFEWEKEIDLKEAQALILLCEKGVIDKTRYIVPNKNLFFEVDVFEGENQGLIVAEIELNDKDETFEQPVWLGEEVTNQECYYNAYISKKPFTTW